LAQASQWLASAAAFFYCSAYSGPAAVIKEDAARGGDGVR